MKLSSFHVLTNQSLKNKIRMNGKPRPDKKKKKTFGINLKHVDS